MRLFIAFAFLCLSTSLADATAQLSISPAACDQLVNYIEPPGVEYQPGVDANGDAIVPADVGNRRPVKPPAHIVIPITEYLANRLANGQATTGAATTIQAQTNTTAAGVLQPQVNLGTVEVTNGQVTYNGQPLNGDVDGDLAALCRKIRGQQ